MVVTYPDGSQEEVPVKVVVTKAPEKTPTDAEKYTPQGQEVTTVQDQVPQAESGVSNKSELPKETKYAWKTPLNVSTPGEKQGTVVVTYPDGSQEEVPVKVVVTKAPEKTPTDAEKYTPQGQKVTTAQDQMPQAESGVANKSELPKETKYAWKTPLNVSTMGEHQETLMVTYPDASQDEVSVTVKVDARVNGTKTMQLNKPGSKQKTAKNNVDNNVHSTKESLPQTGENDEKKVLFVGTLLTLIAGVLGAELFNKKHSKDQK
ncbi:Rib/alpha-like domain-containing protein [uncultured Ligilactobacillus sp.]|uniref:Rib/alpha-like domain-containing protein n=1 Tax=uncultured Ligilactobacillus sp. TaxID=2837633 RepID=UPI00272A1278|nr:Rib/alpha-like domain-containing protein [uncultured Ligilactobacillus sp.]